MLLLHMVHIAVGTRDFPPGALDEELAGDRIRTPPPTPIFGVDARLSGRLLILVRLWKVGDADTGTTGMTAAAAGFQVVPGTKSGGCWGFLSCS